MTPKFPRCELKEVEEDIRKRSFDERGNALGSKLPKLPDVVDGGDIDILIGCKYLRYFPKPDILLGFCHKVIVWKNELK